MQALQDRACIRMATPPSTHTGHANRPSDYQLALCVIVKVTGTVATCCCTPRKAWTLRRAPRAARPARRRVLAAAAEAGAALRDCGRRGPATGTATATLLTANACMALVWTGLLTSFELQSTAVRTDLCVRRSRTKKASRIAECGVTTVAAQISKVPDCSMASTLRACMAPT